MKKIISLFLLTSLMLPFGLKFGVLLDYAVAYDYYVNELCEQREVADNTCKGQCELGKKWQETEKSPVEPTAPKLADTELLPFKLEKTMASHLNVPNHQLAISENPYVSCLVSTAAKVLTPPPKQG